VVEKLFIPHRTLAVQGAVDAMSRRAANAVHDFGE
jgi:hypothetical protein